MALQRAAAAAEEVPGPAPARSSRTRPPPIDLEVPPVPRLPALDVARGLAIVLVVLHHAVLHLDAAHLLPAAWRVVNGELVLLRMPLFFCVSGLLAASAAQRSWGWLLRARLVPLLWVFALWSVLRFALFRAVTPTFQPWEADSLVPLLLAPVRPTTGLWYLYALAAFTVLARALGRAVPLVLLPAAVLSVAAAEQLVRAPYYVWQQMARCLVFFLLGWCLRRWLLRLLERLGTAAAAALAGGGALLLGAHGAGLVHGRGAGSAVSALSVLGGLGLAVLLARLPEALAGPRVGPRVGARLGTRLGARLGARAGTGLGAAAGVVRARLSWLGRRTLPVYLAHELVLGTGVSAAVALGAGAAGGAGARPAWAPPLVVLVSLALPLAVHALARRAGAGWLYAPPAAVLALVDRALALVDRVLAAVHRSGRAVLAGAPAAVAGRPPAAGDGLGSPGAAVAFGDGRAGAAGVARGGGVRGAGAGGARQRGGSRVGGDAGGGAGGGTRVGGGAGGGAGLPRRDGARPGLPGAGGSPGAR
ncbi:acyltransferase family protein [Kineococcus gypseus]|uniref:acyltransferase family protein n=1 Tax=Kineococcus gypseus TaxID=1637102 RepID=UPI003D7E3AB7